MSVPRLCPGNAGQAEHVLLPVPPENRLSRGTGNPPFKPLECES